MPKAAEGTEKIPCLLRLLMLPYIFLNVVRGMSALFQHTVFFEYPGDSLECAVDLLHGMCGHEAESDKSVGRSHSR